MPFSGFKDFDECVGRISSRTNPKTKKPYSSESAHKICGSLQSKHEKKSVEYKSYYLPLGIDVKDTHFEAILNSSALDLGNDLVSDECIRDMVRQINSAIATFKGSYLHDAILEKNPNLPPLSKMEKAEYMDGGKIRFEGIFNELHPEWEKAKPMIEQGFLDGISIEYFPEKKYDSQKDGKTIRVLDKVKLLGYGHVPRPMNLDSAIIRVFQKSFDEFQESEPSDEELTLLDGSNSEVGPMEVIKVEETKTVTLPTDVSTATTTVSVGSTTAEVKQEEASAPESKEAPVENTEVIQLKAQLEAQKKELEEVKARLSDKAYIEEIKSQVLAKVKELQPENKILIPSETKVAESLMKADFSDYIAARAAIGG